MATNVSRRSAVAKRRDLPICGDRLAIMYQDVEDSKDIEDGGDQPELWKIDQSSKSQPLLPIIKHREIGPESTTSADSLDPKHFHSHEDEEELYASIVYSEQQLQHAQHQQQQQQQQTAKPRKKAPELTPMERRNWLIHSHFIRRDWDSCKALIKEQLDETRGACEYASYVKGLILKQEGKIQESLDSFQNCAMVNPQNPLYLKQIARSLFLMGKATSAVAVLDEAMKLSSADWEIYHWKGVCYYHMGDLANAQQCLKQAVGISKHEETHTLLGKIARQTNDYVNAIDSYKRALELSPENPDLLTTLGLLYLKTGSQQQAFESLGRALGYDPSHSGAIMAAGSMMQQHGDYDVALTKYRVVAAEWPDSPQLWSNIGMCFFGKKKYVAAVSCLKRANYLAPFDWKILYNLGVVQLEMQQYASAFHYLSSAINVNPKVAILYMTLAVALTHLDDFDNARQAYERSLKLDQRDPALAFNYAVFSYKQNDQATASVWLNAYYQRLQTVRDSKTGMVQLDKEILDMADKLAEVLQINRSKQQNYSGSDSRANGSGTETPSTG